MSYLDTVKNFVVENFLFGDGNQLEDNTSFLESGIIDSTGILELVLFLEETYEIEIGEEEVIPENLNSVQNISSFLHRKMNGG